MLGGLVKAALGAIPEGRNRDVALVAGGMTGLLAGQRLASLAMFGKGLKGLEQRWRDDHPEFEGGLRARWDAAAEFYDATHQDPTNRALHLVGIPMIVGGAVGLLATRPYNPLWWGSAGAYTAGWALNFVGHGAFEKKAPAFADDPLSFFVGPVWDAQQVAKSVLGRGKASGDGAGSQPPAAEVGAGAQSAAA